MVALAVCAVAVIVAACSAAAGTANPEAPTRRSSETVGAPAAPGPPGQVINAAEAPPPVNARAWLFDYHSRALDGRDIAERAMLVVPMVAPPADGFPLVVWGHSTKGSADQCAPSAQGPAAIPLIDDLVAEGYAVVAPDYEGLGAAGPHPYLVGESEGRSMLDAARGAAQIKGSGVRTSSPIIFWGFSQGGHAATFAAQIAPAWAPELQVRGVAVAAPVADVDHFVRRAEAWPEQFGVLVAVVAGFHAAYPELEITPVLKPQVLDELDQLEKDCIAEITAFFNRPINDMLLATPRTVLGWGKRFAENQSGTTKIGVPVLVIQGELDQIVDPVDTAALVDRYCTNGVPVAYLVRPGENHGVLSSDVLRPWIRGRLVGDKPPDTCANPAHRG